jgi:hypothetical protein
MLTRRNMAILGTLVALFLGIGLGCEDDQLVRGDGVLDGYVYLGGASEHSGTMVDISGWRAGWWDTCGCVFSDSSGYYRFEGIPDGTWDLHFSHPLYFEVNEHATMRNGFLVDPPTDVYLTKALWGKVHLQGQDDHSGICIRFARWDWVDWTYSDGAYLLPPIPDGEYTLTFSFPGYDRLERPLTITDGLAQPALGETTLVTDSLPVVVQLFDLSRPEYNPEGSLATVTVSVLDQSGTEVWKDQYVDCRESPEHKCGCGLIAIPDLLPDTPYDIVLTVQRYFVLGYYDRGASTDSMAMNGVTRGADSGARTPPVVLYSYWPNSIQVIFRPEVDRAEAEEIILSLDCSIDLVSWSSYYGTHEYRLTTPESRTEWEMIGLFRSRDDVILASIRVINPYSDF